MASVLQTVFSLPSFRTRWDCGVPMEISSDSIFIWLAFPCVDTLRIWKIILQHVRMYRRTATIVKWSRWLTAYWVVDILCLQLLTKRWTMMFQEVTMASRQQCLNCTLAKITLSSPPCDSRYVMDERFIVHLFTMDSEFLDFSLTKGRIWILSTFDTYRWAKRTCKRTRSNFRAQVQIRATSSVYRVW